MLVKIKNISGNPLPEYQTEGSAGMDICAFIEEPVLLKPGDRKAIPTGLFLEIPDGYEAQIRPRSGLALKYGIGLPNSPATIDSDYRGELKVIIMNYSTEDFRIHSGDRIAQMVIARYEKVTWKQVETLTETQRGEGGFGHTGK
ncbi:MAG: dUTP diphosphatase [Chitinophagales bacterium]|nr:dUTP diphosphatase [Chitinophagales bacterium]